MTAYVVLGNPENRRVGLFQEALAAEGLPPAVTVSWRAFLADPAALDALPDSPAFLRIDSCGESFEVERALLRRGGVPHTEALVEERGRVFEPRRQHDGFLSALVDLEGVIARHPSWRVLNQPNEIRELFDKRLTSRHYRGAGIPVPEFLEEEVRDTDALLAALKEREWTQAFVKISCGSSASCLALVHVTDGEVAVRTTLERDGGKWFNNLKLRHLKRMPDVRLALDFILSQGAQVERAIPKARIDDAWFDLRVLCVAREPAFIVVRQNHHPITNLHLGGWRGDLEKLRAAVPRASWDAAMDSCRKVAALYRSLHVGLDLMFEPGLQAHRIIEGNAFGDLLPNLLREGRSVYRWEIAQALGEGRGNSPAP